MKNKNTLNKQIYGLQSIDQLIEIKVTRRQKNHEYMLITANPALESIIMHITFMGIVK